MTTSRFSSRVLQKWRDLDDVLGTEHSFTAAGIIGVSESSEVAVFFNPVLDKDEVRELRTVLREQEVPWPDAPNWVDSK